MGLGIRASASGFRVMGYMGWVKGFGLKSFKLRIGVQGLASKV